MGVPTMSDHLTRLRTLVVIAGEATPRVCRVHGFSPADAEALAYAVAAVEERDRLKADLDAAIDALVDAGVPVAAQFATCGKLAALIAECDRLKATLESEIGKWVNDCKRLKAENARLRADLLEMAEKYARQSAALGQAAERRTRTTHGMAAQWCVEVHTVNGKVLTLAEGYCSGKETFTDEEEDTIRGAAEHLLAFVGERRGV
jgi:hypothetical protein